jgi:hypothetical protein
MSTVHHPAVARLSAKRPLRLPLAVTIPLLVAFYAVGAVWAAAEDLKPLGSALLNGSVLNAPLVIVAAQLAGAIGLCRARGRRAAAAGTLLALSCAVSIAAFLSDGDHAHEGLGPQHVVLQCLIGAATAVTLGAVAERAWRSRRARA